MFKKIKGFTLIELLIVMAVIAILIGIAIPSFRSMQTDAKVTKAQGDIRVVKLAVEAYNAKNSALPTALSSVEGGSVLQVLPKDPFSPSAASNYGYEVSGTYYVIWSYNSSGTVATISWSGSTPTPSVANTIGTTNGTLPSGSDYSYWK